MKTFISLLPVLEIGSYLVICYGALGQSQFKLEQSEIMFSQVEDLTPIVPSLGFKHLLSNCLKMKMQDLYPSFAKIM